MAKRGAEDDLQQAQKRFRPDFQDITTVLVGDAEESFIVHMKNICDKSPFFEAACSKKWKEGQDKVVKLPTIEPYVFEIYVNWVYKDKIDIDVADHPPEPLCQPGEKCSEDKRYCRFRAVINTLHRLYAAADMLVDTGAKALVMDTVRENSQEFIADSDHVIEFVWENCPAGCGLQRFYLDFYAALGTPKMLQLFGETVPKQFCIDLAKRQAETRGISKRDAFPLTDIGCRYHDHEEGKSCEDE